MLRRACLLALLGSLGCHSFAGLDPEPKTAQAGTLTGQDQAIAEPRRPEKTSSSVEVSVNHLHLAASYLDSGKEEEAQRELAEHVDAHPDDLLSRAHYAELLFRLRRFAEARVQFERYTRDVGDAAANPPQVIHAYSRLMEIAAIAEDPYEEHVNRGVGLYLLARRRAQLAASEGDLPPSGLLWKSIAELKQAQELRPNEARPAWYLYSAWRALGQNQPAQRCLRCALDNARFSSLYSREQRSLYLAGQALQKGL